MVSIFTPLYQLSLDWNMDRTGWIWLMSLLELLKFSTTMQTADTGKWTEKDVTIISFSC